MKKPLSKNIEKLLWDVDTTHKFEHSLVLFERILNYGDVDDVAWLFENFDKEEIVNFIETTGKRRLSKKSLIFWSKYFDIENILGNTPDKTEATFGKDRWL